MTGENLARGGTPFVEHFLQTMYDSLRGAK